MVRYRRIELVVLTVALTAVFTQMSTIVLRAALAPPAIVESDAPVTVRLAPGAPRLTRASRPAYQEWQTMEAVGAFAVSEDGAWGRTHGYASMAAARRDAIATCAPFTDLQCRVYATRAPDGLHDHPGFIAHARNRATLAAYRAKPMIRAFAIAPNGATGWSWGYGSHAEAASRALAACRASTEHRVRGRAEDTDCVLVRVDY